MRATSAQPARPGDDWIWEPRLPGARCLAFVQDGRAEVRSGRGLALDALLPDLTTLLPSLVRGDAILDGIYSNGAYHLFDCLHFEGVSLTPLPLVDRKAVLRDAVWFDDRVRFTPFRSSGRDAACQAPSAAGVVAKRAQSPYVGGVSRDWLALTSAQAREFVIGGFVQPSGHGSPAALLIGVYDGGRLHYAGRVTSECEPGAMAAIGTLLHRLRRRTTPFSGAVPEGSGIHWTSPALVAQVGFADWTPAGLLRRPRFIGLRFDREPDEVRRERIS